MKLIIFVLLTFLVFTAFSTSVKDGNQGVDVFQPGVTYVFDPSIQKWKSIDPEDIYKAISLHYVVGIDQVRAQLKY